MPVFPPIFLASGGSSGWDVVIWVIAGVIWLFTQMASAKKKQEKKTRQQPQAKPAAPRGGDAPSPDELAEIFKRLGADIPSTPPPAPKLIPTPARPAMARTSTIQMSSRPAPRPTLRKPPAPIAPELARRLARVRKEAEEAANEAETIRIAENAIVPGVQSRAGEHRALDTATRHTGTILPRLYAMGIRLAPLPPLPIPGFGPTHHVGQPLRAKLHSRREVRDALIAQTFLSPAKFM